MNLLLIVITSILVTGMILPHAFSQSTTPTANPNDSELLPDNGTQFNLKINDTFTSESGTFKIHLLNVTSDSRCPDAAYCIWQGEVTVSVGVTLGNQYLGNSTLSTLSGHDKIAFGNYDLVLSQVNPSKKIGVTISPSDYVITFAVNNVPVDSPLKQFKSGIAAKDVKCKQGYQLIIRNENGEPACVTPETASILVDRGWGGLTPVGLQVQSSTPQNSTLPASFMPCDTPFPPSSGGVPVLYMPTNSIGKLCVRYSNLNNFPAPIGIRIFDANNLTSEATGISTWNDLGGNTTISNGDSTVVYWIKTGNQSEFYGLTLFCSPEPLAVGYDNNSNLVSSNFPWLGQIFECPMMSYSFHIDSTTGIGVKYIQSPSVP